MSPETQQFILTLLIKVLVVVAIPFIIKVVYDLYVQGVTYLKDNVSAGQLASVKAIINFLVLAAEQTGLAGNLLQTGAEKKAWVLSEADRILRELGFDVFADNVETLINLLEAAVFTNFNQFDWPEVSPDEPVPAPVPVGAGAMAAQSDYPKAENYLNYDEQEYINVVDGEGRISTFPDGELYALVKSGDSYVLKLVSLADDLPVTPAPLPGDQPAPVVPLPAA